MENGRMEVWGGGGNGETEAPEGENGNNGRGRTIEGRNKKGEKGWRKKRGKLLYPFRGNMWRRERLEEQKLEVEKGERRE
jgi:hypothetical protein